MLHIEELAGGNVKVTADSGKVKDTRSDRVYAVVICKEKQKARFVEGE